MDLSLFVPEFVSLSDQAEIRDMAQHLDIELCDRGICHHDE